MRKTLTCPYCKDDHTHFLATIRIRTDYEEVAKSLKINDRYSIDLDFPYQFRSRENIHLLFRCENNHYFIESYDDHKGQIFINQNDMIEDLERNLNAYTQSKDVCRGLDTDFFKAITIFAQNNKVVEL